MSFSQIRFGANGVAIFVERSDTGEILGLRQVPALLVVNEDGLAPCKIGSCVDPLHSWWVTNTRQRDFRIQG
jgi:hypothetical protein